MGRVPRALRLHDRDALFDFLIGHVQPELAAKHIVVLFVALDPGCVKTRG